MNTRRLLLSAAVLVFAGSVVAGGTGAFFSDEERSEGNVFAAGSLDLKVDSEAHYAGLECVPNSSTEVGAPTHVWQIEDAGVGTSRPDLVGDACDGSWVLTDLGPSNKFFNLSDLKPGDSGENTISLHVSDNPAYACAVIDNMTDVEVGTCTEPETEDGDTTCTNGAQGELADELRFFAWAELDGDNVWEPTGEETPEPTLFSNTEGPASDVLDGVAYELFAPDLNGGATTDPTKTQYIGLYWCYGDITVDPSGATFADRLKCDGEPVDNLSQSDKLSADITFYVEQARNNAGFTCPEPRKPEAEVTSATGWSPVDLDANGGGQGKEWFAKARNNNSGFELAIGTNDASPATQSTAEATWVADQVENFTLSYDGGGNATLSVVGKTPVTYPVGGVGALSRIGVNVKAPASVTTTVDNLSLDIAAPLSDDDVSVVGGNAVSHLLISGVDLNQAWSLTGTFVFSGLTGSAEYPAVQFSID